MLPITPPRERRLTLNGLEHRLCAWGPEGADDLILLLHGWLDTSRSYDAVATHLTAAFPQTSIVAMDWRGHGDSEWAPPGCYYHFYDYVADLAALIAALPHRRLALVGHSMGGNVASYFGGARPEGLWKVALMESMIVPDTGLGEGPERVRGWLEALEEDPRGRVRILEDLDAAARGLKITMAAADDALISYLAPHATRPIEGGYTWKFDPLHRVRGPSPFLWGRLAPFLGRLRCPVLAVEGALTPWLPRELEERYKVIPDLRRAVIPGASHAMHVEQPQATAEALISFLKADEGP